MALVLNIDTAVQAASICLCDDNKLIGELTNPIGNESAGWLHVAVQTLLQENNISPAQLQCVAVSAGPGSYTGLRVGMSAAKGLCYALKIPLITINTLQMMAAAATPASAELICPMIDARRMEVFTALYNSSLQEIMPSTNLILTEESFLSWLEKSSICFFGNGSEKAKQVINHPNACFISVMASAKDMAALAQQKFEAGQFSDLAYAEPFYGKDFHSPLSKKNY